MSRAAPAANRVVEAATVLCIRRKRHPVSHVLSHADVHLNADAKAQLGEFAWPFHSGFEVLMGQSEVVNWVRSTPDRRDIMRYAGEFKFAGGTRDQGEELVDTAKRELAEEFVLAVPADACLRPLRVNSTRAIKGVSYLMFNYVALTDENPWLDALDTDELNGKLADKRQAFTALLQGGGFWQLSKQEKELVSPEVREVQWVDLHEAARLCVTSKGESLTPVNDFQRESFALHGIQKRDPMYATMLTLLAVEKAGTMDGLREASVAFEATLAEDIKRASAESAAQAAKGVAYGRDGSRL
jgi:8-oxo-dGTP pyrophosphatase MutT (NUDIX family)